MNVELDHSDFALLYTNSMKWGIKWADHTNRFQTVPFGGFVDWDLRRAYWFADAASMVLARAYLRSIELRFQVLSDEVDGSYVIVTDYEA